MRRYIPTHRQPVIHLTTARVAVRVVVVTTHRRRNVPTIVIAGRIHRHARTAARRRRRRILRLHHPGTTQGHGHQDIHTLSLHLGVSLQDL
ncbi:hypothetical protein ALSL_1652 [Aerosticca soli]|uniref:Uncharacterized protein n=1 Tax=Aerosticca soli TaxID=2010829 RepID=A0A2Z6E585_9GAMM|nr:hypothetical protein ALSL_1652 [Aerosticca soli]